MNPRSLGGRVRLYADANFYLRRKELARLARYVQGDLLALLPATALVYAVLLGSYDALAAATGDRRHVDFSIGYSDVLEKVAG